MPNQTENQIPKGYEKVAAGEFAPYALYKCAKCGAVFVSGHYTTARFATGRTINHCDTVAYWLMNLRRKEKDEEKEHDATDGIVKYGESRRDYNPDQSEL